MFHLDEYVGLPINHPASFRRYLLDRLITKVGIGRYHLLDGEQRSGAGGASTSAMHLPERPIDLAFVGIGENGHLAFNDPPADFTTDEPVSHRDARRSVPPAAGRRRLVRVD